MSEVQALFSTLFAVEGRHLGERQSQDSRIFYAVRKAGLHVWSDSRNDISDSF